MSDDCIYSREDVCKMLNISYFTINNWYRWEKKAIEAGIVIEPYLPTPVRLMNTKGKPLRWSQIMVEKLKGYQESIVHGRNGNYGVYTNPKKH